MKKFIVLLLTFILFIPNIIFASDNELNIYLFHGEHCPHCMELINFLDDYLSDKDYIKLNKYEVWNNEENNKLFNEIKDITDIHNDGVPYLIIGDKVILGYTEYDNEEIINTINYYINTSYIDKVGNYINKENNTNNSINYIVLPSNIKKYISNCSILLKSIILGFLSSFNISSFLLIILVLCFISLYKDKSIKILIGSLFIFIYLITNILFLSNIFDNSLLLDKTIYLRLSLSIILLFYSTIKVLRLLNKKDKYNKVISIIIFIISFILISIIYIYSNICIPSLFNNIVYRSSFIYKIIYCLFSVLLYILFIILYLLISKLKYYKKHNNIFFIVSCILIFLIGILFLL